MKANFKLLIILAMASVFAACQQDQNIAPPATDQLLAVHTANKISGSITEEGILVTYSVVSAENGTELVMEVNGKQFDISHNYDNSSVRYDGRNNSLTQKEASALDNTVDRIAYALKPDAITSTAITMTKVESSLMTSMSHLSDVPVGYAIGKLESDPVTFDAEKGVGNDGIGCIKKGNHYWLEFNDRNGAVTTLYKRVDSKKPCRGRCGAGCGRWWLASGWTIDCFEHDWCVATFGGSSLSGNDDCGDEWWQAADDWGFGLWWCNGNRES